MTVVKAVWLEFVPTQALLELAAYRSASAVEGNVGSGGSIALQHQILA